MSTGYRVLVRQERWPSNAEIQASLDARGYPVVLLGGAPEAPFAVGTRAQLDLRLDGDPLVLVEIGAAQVSGAAFARDETNEVLAEIGADFRARDGDWHFGVGLGSNPRDSRAAFFLMAALVRDFGGYGYETQAESHGGADWADELIVAAEHFRQQATKAVPRRPAANPAAPATGGMQDYLAAGICVVLGGGLIAMTLANGGNLALAALGAVMLAMGIALFWIKRRTA